MTKRQSQKIGTQRNKLLRYKKVLEFYEEHYNPDVPITVFHRKYIYPAFAISRTTFYEILRTPVDKKLKEIKAIEENQLSMF